MTAKLIAVYFPVILSEGLAQKITTSYERRTDWAVRVALAEGGRPVAGAVTGGQANCVITGRRLQGGLQWRGLMATTRR